MRHKYKYNTYQENRRSFLIVSSVQRISLLYGFKTVQQTARAKEIIEGVKQSSFNSFGMAFIIILLIMTSSVSLAFHKFVYASII